MFPEFLHTVQEVLELYPKVGQDRFLPPILPVVTYTHDPTIEDA
jgi:hypothetical protein